MENTFRYTYGETDLACHRIGEGRPLIVLHGWGSSSGVMKPLASQLADLRTCYLVDLPGFGESPAPEEAWSVDDYADLVERFTADLEEDSADLLVHSFGGRIALKLLSRPSGRELFDKVLITGGAGMKPRRSPLYFLRKYTAKLLKAPFFLLPASLREKGLERLRETAAWKALGSGDYGRTSGIMREIFVKTVTEHLEGCLPDIPHEVLLLWGEQDRMTPLYQAERMEKGLENSALVTIEEAGHYAFLDRPGRFVRIARAFFEV